MDEHNSNINNPTLEAAEARERGKRWLTELQQKVGKRRTEEAARTAAEDAELAAAEDEFGRALAEDQLKARVADVTERFNTTRARHDEATKAANAAKVERDALIAKLTAAEVAFVTAELARCESGEQLRGQWRLEVSPLGLPIGEPRIEPKRCADRSGSNRAATAVRELTIALHPEHDQAVERLLRHSPKQEQRYWAGGREVTEYR